MDQIFSCDEAVLMNRLADVSPTKCFRGQQIFAFFIRFLGYDIQLVLDAKAPHHMGI